MKCQFVCLNVVTVCLNELGSVCLNGCAGQGKLSRRYPKVPVRIFKKSVQLKVATVAVSHVYP